MPLVVTTQMSPDVARLCMCEGQIPPFLRSNCTAASPEIYKAWTKGPYFFGEFFIEVGGGGMPRVRQGQGEESKAWGQALLCWVAGEECPPTFKQKAPV